MIKKLDLKWLIVSALLALFNIVLILLFAASKLGPTPYQLPLISRVQNNLKTAFLLS
jgi:hypothetical protein